LTQGIDAHTSSAGFSPAENVRVQTLSAARIYDKNDDAHPETVVPQVSHVQLEGAERDYSFPHQSVTVVDFHKKN